MSPTSKKKKKKSSPKKSSPKKSSPKKSSPKKRAKGKAPAGNIIVEAANFVGKAVVRRVGGKLAEMYDIAEDMMRHDVPGAKKSAKKKAAPKKARAQSKKKR